MARVTPIKCFQYSRSCFSHIRGSKCVNPRLLHTKVLGRPCPSLNPLQRLFLPSQLTRGLKRKSSITVNEEHGLLPAVDDASLVEDNEPIYPTVVQQARNNMRKFSDCVLLTRVGNFYELYLEQADEYGPLLNLKVARKETKAGPVSMSGFQIFQLERYLKILVQDLHKHVAISEEFANDAAEKAKSGGLLFDRRVARVITPGTLIDEKFMEPWENNYLLGIRIEAEYERREREKRERLAEDEHSEEDDDGGPRVGLAWVDLSTGDFFTQTTGLLNLPSVMAKIGAREIVLDLNQQDSLKPLRAEMSKEDERVLTYYESSQGDTSRWDAVLEAAPDGFMSETFSPLEIATANLLLQYVDKQLLEFTVHLQPPVRQSESEFMVVDRNTLRALEVRSTLRDGKPEGSLLHTIRKTVTKSGARLLNQRLASPSMSLEVIKERLDLVEELIRDPALRQDLMTSLRMTFDSMRLVQKFAFGRGDADDLLSLSRTIKVTLQIAEILERPLEAQPHPKSGMPSVTEKTLERQHIENLLSRLDLGGPKTLSDRIHEVIDEEGLSEQHRVEDLETAKMIGMANEVIEEEGEGKVIRAPKKNRPHLTAVSEKEIDPHVDDDVWVMRRDASLTLSRLHNKLDDFKQDRTALVGRLKQLGATSATLRWTSGLGHICHVKAKDASIIANLPNTRSVSSSKTTRSFHITEWTHLGTIIDQAKQRIRAEEHLVFNDLRALVVRNLVKLRRNASVLDELDVACSFATLAADNNFVRPIMNSGTRTKIIGGRHPMVETGVVDAGHKFTPNDCTVGDKERILLITGPNMAGKSTFLRQNALITILAQTGSFVPAEYAEIGLVDKIFSRVGTADNLFEAQSTFMVEMLETAEILKQATPRSFVIMDEVGRGTTPEDGIAVGYATLCHLYRVNRCRTLFATHFHALTDMTKGFERLACYCTDVHEEDDGSFEYVHTLKKGVNRQSHALKVARLAGLPELAIAEAAKVLKDLQAEPSDMKDTSTTKA